MRETCPDCDGPLDDAGSCAFCERLETVLAEADRIEGIDTLQQEMRRSNAEVNV